MPAPTGITWLDALIIPAIAVTALTALGLGVHRGIRLLRWLYHTAKRIEEFLRQWFGTDAEPGVPKRLERIEWHVGNGRPEPLHTIAEQTKAELHDHLVQADEDRRELYRVARRIDKEE